MSAIERGDREPARGVARGGPARAGDALPRHGERVGVVGCGTSLYIAAGVRGAAGGRRPRRDRRVRRLRAADGPRRTTSCSRSRARARRPRCSTPSRSSASALRRSRSRRSPTSPVARAAGGVVTLPFADEQSVVQTRFATTALVLLRAHVGIDSRRGDRGGRARRSRGRCRPTPPASSASLFLGRGWTVGLAYEAALKLREAARAWSEAYPAMEYRHGPIAIADSRTARWFRSATLDPDLDSDIRAHRARPSSRTGGRSARLARPRPAARGRARPGSRGLDPSQPPQPHTIGGAPMRRSLLPRRCSCCSSSPPAAAARAPARRAAAGQHRALARVHRRRGQGAQGTRRSVQRARTPTSTSPSRTTATPTTRCRRC